MIANLGLGSLACRCGLVSVEATADWEDEVFCPSAKVMRPGCTGEFLDSGVTVLDSGVTDRGSRESLVFVGLPLF